MYLGFFEEQQETGYGEVKDWERGPVHGQRYDHRIHPEVERRDRKPED